MGGASPLWAQDVRGLPLTKDVATTAGRVRGVVRFGVNQFWGVPYAASTEAQTASCRRRRTRRGAARATASRLGNRSPQDPDGPISEVFALDRQEPMGEDCLNLNVFTPALTGNRPVMVWLHGGGFAGRIWQLAAVRRHQPRSQRRRRRRVGDSPAEPVRLPAPLELRRRREVGALEQRGHAGHRCGAWLDQGQHRGVWRQSRQRHGVRPVGRRQQGDDADGDAVGEGSLSSSDRDERCAGSRC